MNRLLNAIVALAIPIVVLGGWTAMITHRLATGRVVHLPIQGFDPRDLLSGHFLRYQLDLGPKLPCAFQSDSRITCVCLPTQERIDLLPPDQRIVDAGLCEEMTSCEVKLQGRCQNGNFATGLERFYFPEGYTLQLTSVPPDSRLEVALDPVGKAATRNFYVGDKPLKDFLRPKPPVPAKHPAP